MKIGDMNEDFEIIGFRKQTIKENGRLDRRTIITKCSKCGRTRYFFKTILE